MKNITALNNTGVQLHLNQNGCDILNGFKKKNLDSMS